MSLSEEAYASVAAALAVPVAAVRAVAEVESSGQPYWHLDGKKVPPILFEAHHFGRLTGYRYNDSHPEISSTRWNRALYKGGPAEYGRLAEAKALDELAALQSASWGPFQVMGFNWKELGYGSVHELVDAMKSEAGQLDPFVRYIERHRLAEAMRHFPEDWACQAFARGYNGQGAVAEYAPKIANAFYAHGGGAPGRPRTLRIGARGDDVAAVQSALGITADGDFGRKTEIAVLGFQVRNGLTTDGIVGPRTRAALEASERSAA